MPASEADELVDAVRRANLNALFVQVRRRGDALYTKGSTDVIVEAGTVARANLRLRRRSRSLKKT
jgi:uncharacterized lipoprotein YddW (UPF0748 family)